jgi:hypothetical protein
VVFFRSAFVLYLILIQLSGYRCSSEGFPVCPLSGLMAAVLSERFQSSFIESMNLTPQLPAAYSPSNFPAAAPPLPPARNFPSVAEDHGTGPTSAPQAKLGLDPHAAARGGDVNFLSDYLAKGGDINATDSPWRNTLLHCVSRAYCEIAELETHLLLS